MSDDPDAGRPLVDSLDEAAKQKLYDELKQEIDAPKKRRVSMIVMLVLAWLYWGFLIFSIPCDLLIVSLQDKPTESAAPVMDDPLGPMLGFIGFCSLALSFVARWFFLRFLIHPNRVSPSSAGAPWLFAIGAIIVLSLAKAPEVYGLILFFRMPSFVVYLAFAVPSFTVLLIHMPWLLDPSRRRSR